MMLIIWVTCEKLYVYMCGSVCIFVCVHAHMLVYFINLTDIRTFDHTSMFWESPSTLSTRTRFLCLQSDLKKI